MDPTGPVVPSLTSGSRHQEAAGRGRGLGLRRRRTVRRALRAACRGALRLGCVRLRRVGVAAALGPVRGPGQSQDDQDREDGHRAVVRHGQEERAAHQRREHGREGGALDPPGQQLLRLAVLLALLGQQQPREAVEDQADAAGDGEDAEHDPEDHRVQVEVPAEAPAHAREDLVAPAAAQRRPVGGVRHRGGTGGGGESCTSVMGPWCRALPPSGTGPDPGTTLISPRCPPEELGAALMFPAPRACDHR